MLRAHTVDEVRAAEAVLLAELPEDALMLRAAHGLAYAVLDWLGRGYGARVLLLVGAGNNGGDALHAGAVLARRGAGVEAVLLAPDRVHATGLAAFRGAGGRVVTAAEATTPDVVVDGIVGHRGDRAGSGTRRWPRWPRCPTSPSSPWTCRRAWTWTPVRSRARTSRPR